MVLQQGVSGESIACCSVIPLAIGEMILLIRDTPDKLATSSFEIRNKKPGIVGYGSIGTPLSVVAESLGSAD